MVVKMQKILQTIIKTLYYYTVIIMIIKLNYKIVIKIM